MPLSLAIDFSDRDLKHFREAMDSEGKAAEDMSPEDVVAVAGRLLTDAQQVHIPDFVRERVMLVLA
ncbi:MAG: hypothetical protein ACREO8_13855 [Luteimonas sp.]